MWESHGIQSRLYYILNRICKPDKGIDINNLCNMYSVSVDVASKLIKYSNYKEFIKDNGITETIRCIDLMEEKSKKESEQFKNQFSSVYSVMLGLASNYLKMR